MSGSNEIYEFPATPTQQALWFLHSIEPDSTAYHIPMAFRLRGPLRIADLKAAFAVLIARHEILRTVFVDRDGQPLQQVHETMALDWQQRTAIDATTDQALRELAAQTIAQPFDLAAGPLMRVRLDCISDEDALLVVVFHHIIIDHLSLGQLAAELAQLYRDGTESLPEQELQFADYSVWLQEHLALPEIRAKVDVWRQQLEGSPACWICRPTGRDRRYKPVTGRNSGLRYRRNCPHRFNSMPATVAIHFIWCC